MTKLESVAVVAIIEALKKIGETLLDGDRQDDFKDVVNALFGIFGVSNTCDEEEKKDE